MTKDYNKTDRVLLLIQTICKAPRLTLTEAKVKEILDVSRPQYHRQISELITDNGERKAILLKRKDENGNIVFQLNECDWVNYLEGTNEIQFILKSYREMGHLLPKIDGEGISVHSKNIDRRFHYLCKVKAKETESGNSLLLEKIIKALVGSRRLLIKYNGKDEERHKHLIEIFPLTLVQYRDDLYLVACKESFSSENIRHYKVSRITEIMESKEKFRYPTSAKWDPKEYFKNSSGIFVGPEKKARFKVYNESRLILGEKSFYNSQLVSSTKDYDEYECTYTKIEEFMGFLFIYGQDIEILSDTTLKKAFKEKAQKILVRN